MSAKKGPRIQTKRNPTNRYNWETPVNHENMRLSRKYYYKCKSRGE